MQSVLPREQYWPGKKPSKETASAARTARDYIHANFMENNPLCACGCGQPSNQRHHICRGAAKAASRDDTDTQLAAKASCHDKKFDDLDAFPIEKQIAVKILTILEKVNRYRGRAATAIQVKDVLPYLTEQRR